MERETMTAREIAKLMGEHVDYNPDLVALLVAGSRSGHLSDVDVSLLTEAGYITVVAGQATITEAARLMLLETDEWHEGRRDWVQRKEQDREQERAAEMAASFVEQGLLTIRAGRYTLTPAGWSRAASWLRYELKQLHRNSMDCKDYKISANVADYDGIEVGQEIRCNRNRIPAYRWKVAWKRIVASLNDKERELVGLLANKPLTAREKEIKSKILYILAQDRVAEAVSNG